MTSDSLIVIARVVISIALLVWAGLEVWLNPASADHPTAITVVGVVLGYWLGHFDSNVTRKT